MWRRLWRCANGCKWADQPLPRCYPELTVHHVIWERNQWQLLGTLDQSEAKKAQAYGHVLTQILIPSFGQVATMSLVATKRRPPLAFCCMFLALCQPHVLAHPTSHSPPSDPQLQTQSRCDGFSPQPKGIRWDDSGLGVPKHMNMVHESEVNSRIILLCNSELRILWLVFQWNH